MDAAIRRRFALVLPDDVVAELKRVVAAKPYLRRRVPSSGLNAFVETLNAIAERSPAFVGSPPRVCRDPLDDFLVVQAIRLQVDVLVSGDPDLLALDGTGLPFRVLSPRDFLTLLDDADAG